MTRVRRRVGLLLALGCQLIAGCQIFGPGDGESAASPDDRRTQEARGDDRAIERYCLERIAERFGERVQVSVMSFNRTALITGAVPDAGTRGEVEKVVAGAAGVHRVANETEIAGVPSRSARTSDAEIAARVGNRFRDAGKFNPVHVRIVTHTGVVFLMGIVHEKESEDAIELARTTDGVRKVIKIFEYCKASDEACLPRTGAGAPR